MIHFDDPSELSTWSAQQVAKAWVKAQPAVFAFVRSTVASHHDAEDIVQRVIATAIEKCGDYDPARPFVAWIIGIARIEIMRHRQENRRSRLVFSEDIVDRLAQTYVQHEPRLEEMAESLSACLGELPQRSRRILELHYDRSESGASIAEELGVSVNAVFVTMHRIRQALRKCIEHRINGGAA